MQRLTSPNLTMTWAIIIIHRPTWPWHSSSIIIHWPIWPWCSWTKFLPMWWFPNHEAPFISHVSRSKRRCNCWGCFIHTDNRGSSRHGVEDSSMRENKWIRWRWKKCCPPFPKIKCSHTISCHKFSQHGWVLFFGHSCTYMNIQNYKQYSILLHNSIKFIYPGIVPLVIGRLSLTLITPSFIVFHTFEGGKLEST